MDRIYQIVRSIYNLPDTLLAQKWFKANLSSLKILENKNSYTPYLSELEKAVSNLDNDDDAWQGYESLDKETKTTFVLNIFLYVIYKNDDNNVYASEMGEQVYKTIKFFDKLRFLITNRIEILEREYDHFASETSYQISNMNLLYRGILRKRKQYPDDTVISHYDIISFVEQLVSLQIEGEEEEIPIQMITSLKTSERQIGELEKKLKIVKTRIEKLKFMLHLMDLSNSRQIDLIGSLYTKDVNYFSVILDEEDDDISFIVPFTIFVNADEEIWKSILPRISLEKLEETDLRYLVNLELTGMNWLEKINEKYLFEYLNEENLHRVESSTEELIVFKNDIISSLDCNNTMDPFTNEEFSDMSLSDLIHIIKVNGNCYVHKGLLTWLERSNKDPLTNIEFTKNQIEQIKNPSNFQN